MSNNKAVSDFVKGVNKLIKTLTKTSDELEEVVINSVRLLWEHGDIENTVNKVIDASSHSQGLDRRALVTYYRECIPFGFNGKLGRFTTKDKKKHAKMEDTYQQIIADTSWYDFRKEKDTKPYNLSIEAIIKMVNNKIVKARKDGTLKLDTITGLKTGMDNMLNDELNTETARSKSDKLMATLGLPDATAEAVPAAAANA